MKSIALSTIPKLIILPTHTKPTKCNSESSVHGDLDEINRVQDSSHPFKKDEDPQERFNQLLGNMLSLHSITQTHPQKTSKAYQRAVTKLIKLIDLYKHTIEKYGFEIHKDSQKAWQEVLSLRNP